MPAYLGDYVTGATVAFTWDTNAASGASITRATNGTVSVYKNNGTTQSTAGVTDTEDFDGLTGVHACTIDLSADGTFYASGLRPGDYEASVGPDALTVLQAADTVTTIHVDPGAGAGAVDGVALRLTPRVQPDTLPSPAPPTAQ